MRDPFRTKKKPPRRWSRGLGLRAASDHAREGRASDRKETRWSSWSWSGELRTRGAGQPGRLTNRSAPTGRKGPRLPSYKLPLPAHWNGSSRGEAIIAVSATGLPMGAETARLAGPSPVSCKAVLSSPIRRRSRQDKHLRRAASRARLAYQILVGQSASSSSAPMRNLTS